MNRPLDQVDRGILQAVRDNARMPIAEIATRVKVSESTAHRRLRSLIDDRVITKFSAEIDATALGLSTEALVQIRLHQGARSALREFASFLQSLPEIQQVYFVSGGSDFVAHVAVANSAALRDFVSDVISTRPEVASTNTSLIFERL
ncbi:Lrp/AsnC family transcriptional regulator [Corynebacterium lubricantis]|uniref:Lrp/AsnC family transcriptional regulator n=1 Tax=Corynebacterium lubricantis TaxID=541095 RepID=UPI000377479B|nr:Lrp/AsnC family transcriptional regulator [Corynebacterium lubricantis]